MGRIIVLFALVTLTTGCAQFSESRVNPFNWFGDDEEVTPVTTVTVPAPRPLLDELSSLSLDPVPGGVILRVVGLPEQQGYFAGALVRETTEAGLLSYAFRVIPPAEPTRVSTEVSREVVVALFLSDQTLAGVRQIQVRGANNARAVRR